MVRNMGTKLNTLFTDNFQERFESTDWLESVKLPFPCSRLPTPELPLYVAHCIPKQFVLV